MCNRPRLNSDVQCDSLNSDVQCDSLNSDVQWDSLNSDVQWDSLNSDVQCDSLNSDVQWDISPHTQTGPALYLGGGADTGMFVYAVHRRYHSVLSPTSPSNQHNGLPEVMSLLAPRGRIGRALASRAEGRELESWPSQSNDLPNRHLSLPSFTPGITGVDQGLVSSVLA